MTFEYSKWILKSSSRPRMSINLQTSFNFKRTEKVQKKVLFILKIKLNNQIEDLIFTFESACNVISSASSFILINLIMGDS